MKASEDPTGSKQHVAPPLSFLTRLVATGFFSGCIPWASGTFGSIVGVLIYFVPGLENPVIFGALILVGFFSGVVTSARVAAVEGHRLTKTAEFAKAKFQPGPHDAPDPSMVVIDEIVGMWVSLFLLPRGILLVGCAFIAFRIFDILKPFPARQLEKIPNGWGIMLDDIVAGFYANIATLVVVRMYILLFPGFHLP
jgi:phosphatidylglycerophosphatase A